MSFQIKSDKYEVAYARLLRKVRDAIQTTFAEEAERGLAQTDIAQSLDVDASVVSRRLSGTGNVTLRSISDLYTAMGREALSNFAFPLLMDMTVTRRAAPDAFAPSINVFMIVVSGGMDARFNILSVGTVGLPDISIFNKNFSTNALREFAAYSMASMNYSTTEIIDSTAAEVSYASS
jgi:hypothetical protein